VSSGAPLKKENTNVDRVSESNRSGHDNNHLVIVHHVHLSVSVWLPHPSAAAAAALLLLLLLHVVASTVAALLRKLNRTKHPVSRRSRRTHARPPPVIAAAPVSGPALVAHTGRGSLRDPCRPAVLDAASTASTATGPARNGWGAVGIAASAPEEKQYKNVKGMPKFRNHAMIHL
jgi:hypothetical protein